MQSKLHPKDNIIFYTKKSTMKNLCTLSICCCLSLFAMSQSAAFRVEVKGNGKPVLFLPGFACSGSVWNQTINNLAPGFQAHIFTYAGFDGVAPAGGHWNW